jgi:hypothetical protein
MRARRVDSNHSQIISIFRRCGFSVLDLSRVGCGCPDLLVAKAGRLQLVEIKDGAKSASRRKLTPDQVRFHESWRSSLVICNSVEEALMVIQGW